MMRKRWAPTWWMLNASARSTDLGFGNSTDTRSPSDSEAAFRASSFLGAPLVASEFCWGPVSPVSAEAA
eukprot:3477428-Rhodomonas_salina.1